jgi:hypothetical protein
MLPRGVSDSGRRAHRPDHGTSSRRDSPQDHCIVSQFAQVQAQHVVVTSFDRDREGADQVNANRRLDISLDFQ